METKTAQEIAAEIGAPLDNPPSTQDWYPPMHPGIIISQIHYGVAGGPIIAFRIRDTTNGTISSKLPAEQQTPGDDGGVDKQYEEILGLEQHKNLEVLPALYAACPDLDPDSGAVTLMQGGKELLADIVGGNLQNVRPKPAQPTFSVEAGQLVVSLDALPAALQAAASSAVTALSGSKAILKG